MIEMTLLPPSILLYFSLLKLSFFPAYSLLQPSPLPFSSLLFFLHERKIKGEKTNIKDKQMTAMKNAIRCCLSCILPCGVLDVIRIVHANGRVEEISGTVKAEEIMKLHPKHILKKPTSKSDEGLRPRIVVVPPDAELKRGKIYFLIPLPPAPEKTRTKSSIKRKKKESENDVDNASIKTGGSISVANLLISDRYLSEILSEKVSTQRDRRRGRVGVWRPHLESISESPADAILFHAQ